MTWAAETVAATYRATGTAEDLVFSRNGTGTTYAACQATEKQETRITDAGVRRVVRFLEIFIPRLVASPPAENSSVTWNGATYVTGPASTMPGAWRVEAA